MPEAAEREQLDEGTKEVQGEDTDQLACRGKTALSYRKHCS
jgi:hypothetical protein